MLLIVARTLPRSGTSPFKARTMSLKELMQATCILILVYDNFDLLDNFVLTSCIIPPRTFVRSLEKRGALDNKRSHFASTQLLLLFFPGVPTWWLTDIGTEGHWQRAWW